MRKIFKGIIAFILFFTAAPSAFAISGVVVEKTGSLILTRPGGEQIQAQTGDEFDDGAVLSNEKGNALLLFVDGSLVSLSPKQKIKIGDASLKNRVAFNGIQNGVEAAFSLMKMGPAGRRSPLDKHPPAGGIQGVYPVNGSIQLPSSIHFQWKGKNISGEAPVLIFGEKFFFVVPDAKHLNLTRDELDLERGKDYRWYLGHDKIIAQSRVFSFHILSDKEEAALQKDLSKLAQVPTVTPEGKNFLKAQIFYNYQMYHSMVDVLNSLYKKYPTPSVRKLLYLGYVKLGDYKEAKKFETK